MVERSLKKKIQKVWRETYPPVVITDISGKNKKAVKNIGLFYGQLYNKNHFTISHKSLLNKIFKYYTHLVDLLNQTPLDEV